MKSILRAGAVALICASLASCGFAEQLQPVATTVAEGTYLYLDYNRMVEVITQLDLNAEEKSILQSADKELNAIRLYIGSLYQGEGVTVLISALRASDLRSRLKYNFKRVVGVIESHYLRIDKIVPADMRRYEEAAYRADENLGRLIGNDNSKQVDLGVLGSYLGVILRSMIAAKLTKAL